jgi:hypothetical protein
MYNYFLTQALIKEAAALDLLNKSLILKLAAEKKVEVPKDIKFTLFERHPIATSTLPVFPLIGASAMGIIPLETSLILLPLGLFEGWREKKRRERLYRQLEAIARGVPAEVFIGR